MSVGHNADPVGDTQNLRHFRGNNNNRLSLFGHLDDQLIDFVLCANVYTARRFIHHKDLGFAFQPFAKNDLLLVAARQTGDHIVRSHALGVHDLDLLACGFYHFGH